MPGGGTKSPNRLRAAIDCGELLADDLLGLIDAREIEAEPSIETLDAWRSYLLGSAGGLAVAAARLLDAPDPETLRPLGAAYGAAGVLRSIAVLARQQRCLLPNEVLAEHGLSPEAVIARPEAGPVMLELAEVGRTWLAALPRLPRQAIAAALPAVLARRDLRRLPNCPLQRGMGDRLAVVFAGLARPALTASRSLDMATLIIDAVGDVYALLGAVFAAVFLLWGIDRIDPAAAGCLRISAVVDPRHRPAMARSSQRVGRCWNGAADASAPSHGASHDLACPGRAAAVDSHRRDERPPQRADRGTRHSACAATMIAGTIHERALQAGRLEPQQDRL